MQIPTDRSYTRDHEWAIADGAVATVGITDYAQESLGEIVFLELPKIGADLGAGKTFGVVESTKAVSDLLSPVNGKVTSVNSPLVDNPGTINEDPYGEGWLVKIEMADPNELTQLMDAAAYERFVAEES